MEKPPPKTWLFNMPEIKRKDINHALVKLASFALISLAGKQGWGSAILSRAVMVERQSTCE